MHESNQLEMLPDLIRNADGGLTLHIQHDSLGRDKESNWLPAPSGPFLMFLRLFWPKPAALDGEMEAAPLAAPTALDGAVIHRVGHLDSRTFCCFDINGI